MTETIILTILNLISLLVGVKIGQKTTSGKEITLNPVKAIKRGISEDRANKEQELKKKQFATSLANIDKYDGSGFGQEEIPRD